jgi:VCBS repeat-containing protein
LPNDSDPDGDPLNVTSFTQPLHGSVTRNADGSFIYTPQPGYVGLDSFTYTISDGRGGFDTATVTLQVNPVNDSPDAVNDSTTTPMNTPVSVTVLPNDHDPDNDSLNVTGFTQPGNGTVTETSPGVFSYTPNPGFTGTDTFTYTISDGKGGTDTATVTINVTRPTAEPDETNTEPGTPVRIEVLENDDFGEGAQVTDVSQGEHGTVTLNDDGTVTYTPDNGYTGTDTFTYVVTDRFGHDETVTVTVTVTGEEEPEDEPEQPHTPPEQWTPREDRPGYVPRHDTPDHVIPRNRHDLRFEHQYMRNDDFGRISDMPVNQYVHFSYQDRMPLIFRQYGNGQGREMLHYGVVKYADREIAEMRELQFFLDNIQRYLQQQHEARDEAMCGELEGISEVCEDRSFGGQFHLMDQFDQELSGFLRNLTNLTGAGGSVF